MAFRTFIAIEVPYLSKLDEFSRAVNNTGADLKMVNLDTLHITLKFLGETEESLVPEIKKIMKHAVSEIEPFTMFLRCTGAFPNLNRINIVWAGLDNSDAIFLITKKINSNSERSEEHTSELHTH